MLRLAVLALLLLAAACASPRKPVEEPPLDPSITPLTVEQEQTTA